MQNAVRRSSGLVFECPSPSIWMLVGAPVTMAFDGAVWIMSLTDREGCFREGRFFSRDDAIRFLSERYGTGEKAS